MTTPKPVYDRSPWVVHYNCNSCNGCDIEFVACLTPLYDLERFGVVHVGNPKHADMLVVTGSVSHRNARVLKNIYAQMPEPKVVVAMGVCASTGGIFADCYNVFGGADKAIPVDVFVPGCPTRPEAMIDGILRGAEKLAAKRRGLALSTATLESVTRAPAAEAAAGAPPAAAAASAPAQAGPAATATAAETKGPQNA